MNRNKICTTAFLLTIAFVFFSCTKVDIEFGVPSDEIDPAVTYYDDFETEIATLKADSFITSSHQVFAAGYHNDPQFGVLKSGSYAQVTLPSTNPVFGVNVTFDSLELILKPTGQFYGDSTKPVKLNVYRLAQNIKTSDGLDYYYNTSSFLYFPDPIGEKTISLAGKTGSEIRLKLSDELGKEFLEKFRTSADEISSEEQFIDYFRGIYMNTDSAVTSSVSYFSANADSVFIRLSYHENGLYPVSKKLDFTYATAKQFNEISFRPVNTEVSFLGEKTSKVVSSTNTGNKAFLFSPAGTYIKVSFSSLLTLKEKYPYMKVIKAVLVVKPNAASYSFPYTIPSKMYLYSTDETNELLQGFYDGASSPSLLTGDLVVDQLYGENTYYSYDITSFVNSKITEGQFSNSALLLTSSLDSYDTGVQRLIVNDQSQKNSIQLKLYVLGM
ncbi:MAG: DUF4270 family protein [Lacibacter sp.]